MFAHEFFRNALLAGSVVALASGTVGYFLVLRVQVFAGDALSHVAFTGALAAAAAGADTRVGLFAATIAVGLVLAGIGRGARGDDVAIGIVFAWVLGLGVFFLALFSTSSSGGNGLLGARELFGSIFGLSASEARLAAVIGVAIVAALLAIARPLLFASVDPVVAREHLRAQHEEVAHGAARERDERAGEQRVAEELVREHQLRAAAGRACAPRPRSASSRPVRASR